jgi:hypothetical protein
VENNYDPSIPKWVDANYPITFMYDNAQANVLKEALPIQMNHKSRRIRRQKKIP